MLFTRNNYLKLHQVFNKIHYCFLYFTCISVRYFHFKILWEILLLYPIKFRDVSLCTGWTFAQVWFNIVKKLAAKYVYQWTCYQSVKGTNILLIEPFTHYTYKLDKEIAIQCVVQVYLKKLKHYSIWSLGPSLLHSLSSRITKSCD